MYLFSHTISWSSRGPRYQILHSSLTIIIARFSLAYQQTTNSLRQRPTNYQPLSIPHFLLPFSLFYSHHLTAAACHALYLFAPLLSEWIFISFAPRAFKFVIGLGEILSQLCSLEINLVYIRVRQFHVHLHTPDSTISFELWRRFQECIKYPSLDFYAALCRNTI